MLLRAKEDSVKEGRLYTKLILWIFLAAVVCYFGYYIFSAIYAPDDSGGH